MNADRLWKILDSVQAHVRVFDAKAQIVIAIDGILAGFFGSQTVKLVELLGQLPNSILPVVLVATGVTCLVALGASLLYAVTTVHARLQLKQPNSRIFFAHICQEFGRNYEKARQAFSSADDDELVADVSNQILANSIICSAKAERFRKSLFLMSFAVLFWLATLVVQGLVQHQISVSLATPTRASDMGLHVPAIQNVYIGCAPVQAPSTRADNQTPVSKNPRLRHN
jgi:hypothetical protein